MSWTAFQKWAIRGSGLLVFVVLGRMLDPAEFGLAALAGGIVAMFGSITELSLTAFLVRREQTDHRTESTVFWTGLALALVATGIVVALAYPLGDWLGFQDLPAILLVLSPLLLVSAVNAVPTAVLERRLAFKPLAVREVISATVAGIAGIAVAVAGGGVWALVTQALVQAALTLGLVLVFARWKPAFAFDRKVARQLFAFGLPLVGVQLCQAARDRGDQILIGTFLGLDALGVWTVATRILASAADLSISVLDVVAVPVFARVQSDVERFRRVHESAVAACQALLVPVLIVLAVGSPVLVPLVFGPQWEPSVVPTQVLCLTYAIAGLAYFNRPVLIAINRVGLELTLTLIALVLHLTLVLVFTPQGLVVLAIAMAAEAVLTAVIGFWALNRWIPQRLPVSRRAILTLAIGGAAAAGGILAGELSGVPDPAATVLALATAVGAFALGMWLLNRSILRELTADLRRLLQRRSATPEAAV